MSDAGDKWVHAPATKKAVILKEYQDEAARYEQDLTDWGYRTPADSTELLLQFVDPAAKILEAGCGTGLPDQSHYEAGFKNLWGCDFSPEMLAKARARGIHRDLRLVDITQRLPYEDNRFDALTCLATLTHIEDSEPTLREFCRVVRSKGIVLISHRKDLVAARNFDQSLAKNPWQEIHRTGWRDYLPLHPAYAQNQILVGYYVFQIP